MAELEHELESTCRESQDQAAEVSRARAVELLMVERATTAEQGLEAAKACQAKTKAALQKSLADTEAALQRSLETLETERKALESERKA